jgi:dTDP-4-dehydrorhamnose reductase
VIELSHADFDVRDDSAVCEGLAAVHPEVVINTAAFHNVPACEEQPSTAYAVNAGGALSVARWCGNAGVRPIYVSTDYVFGHGYSSPIDESEVPRPVNVYGVTKHCGEQATLQYGGPQATVVRVSGLYGLAECRAKGGANFVNLMLRLGVERGKVRVVDDQFVSPTSTRDAAKALMTLVERSRPIGVVHATSSGSCSWFEFAVEIFRQASLDVEVTPVPSSEFPSPVDRPDYSVLKNAAMEDAGLGVMPTWQEGLAGYLEALSVAKK